MPDNHKHSPLSYRDAGVDIDAGGELIERIKPHVQRTQRPETIGGLGGFGGLFALPVDRFRQPILVSGTDGVGTKLKLAIQLGVHDSIGIDLVAMCVNDILVSGAEPLFFLDYYATGKLELDTAEAVIAGIARGCEMAGCALIGGETAEMPGMYSKDDYDLAGFAVGVVEREEIITGESVKPGDKLIGLPSSGPHSNGYSLIRKIIARSQADLDQRCGETTLGKALLHPTRIYVKAILQLLQQCRPKAMAHITGGGLTENIPRVLPVGMQAVLDENLWPALPVFNWLVEEGNLDQTEYWRTFNCGIGFVICVADEELDSAMNTLSNSGEQPIQIGCIEQMSDSNTVVRITPRNK
ncbi:MAG: phosphoribosylformylglycinamidine cyclo-ligase [Gammaproteobacteria bacterium]|nr:phosphoribosylformylglycinamidine cyclo-ligase [Gammaproteobacteria bacterium]